jgi:hypothetical protein
MGKHALDGEVGLPGIGRSQHGSDTGAASAGVTIDRRREGNGHFYPGTSLGLVNSSSDKTLACHIRAGASLRRVHRRRGTWMVKPRLAMTISGFL